MVLQMTFVLYFKSQYGNMAAFVHETDRLLIVTDINLDIICTV